ncbi:MAG: alpha-L-fucosidase [Cytophagales bacterium]|nr:alpha-L-fucosidase [Cytophagales bacterium]
MFIHFGLYTVPSGVYNEEIMGRNWYAEWIRMQGNWPNGIPDEEYRDFAKQFNPGNFNANEWIPQNCSGSYFRGFIEFFPNRGVHPDQNRN